jgi:uncharacterized surface protein with fasciclin (FAS1) repeats
MTRITKLSAALGPALGIALGATAALAGPNCNDAERMAPGNAAGFSPALYQPATGIYAPARAYRTGMGYDAQHSSSAQASAQPDIVDTAVEAGSFNTLVAAVQAAGLEQTLRGPGPFTVFAPTDAAFAQIPKAQLDALLSDKQALTKVLTYHVVPGTVKAAEVVTLSSAATVEGQPLTIRVGESVMVNNAKVIKTDIVTSNGVIHVIDAVMMPPDMVSKL